MNYDDALTTFWLGLGCINLVCVDRVGLLNSIILWFAVFPVPQGIARAVWREVFARHPDRLWQLQYLAVAPYLIAAGILYYRLSRYYRRKQAATQVQ